MKNKDIADLLNRIVLPGLMALFGLILLVNPDVASRLIAGALGWILILAGIFCGVAAITGGLKGADAVKNGIVAVALVIAGGMLKARPLLLAAAAGYVVGAAMLLRGVMELRSPTKNSGGIASVITGLFLILLPMTTSRLIFRACGIGMLIFGGLMLWSGLKGGRSGDDNIIDL